MPGRRPKIWQPAQTCSRGLSPGDFRTNSSYDERRMSASIMTSDDIAREPRRNRKDGTNNERRSPEGINRITWMHLARVSTILVTCISLLVGLFFATRIDELTSIV